MKKILSLFFFILSVSTNARSPFGAHYSAGAAKFHGDLTNYKWKLYNELQTHFLHVGNEKNFDAYLAVNILYLTAKHTGESFPFDAGAKLSVLAFLFIPTFCYLPNEKWDLCAGIGQGTVNVNSTRNRQDYGTWNYQALVRRYLSPAWSLQLVGKYVGKVEQQKQGTNSYFGFSGLSLGGGWHY